ncbi:EGF-like domain-containing protein 1 [Babylonia areolata]|uniref:EGF-like domain-containing protein 1 n=1 Tax=Babylonia areolata TaxID=304850 RepID=UPI003FD4E9CA
MGQVGTVTKIMWALLLSWGVVTAAAMTSTPSSTSSGSTTIVWAVNDPTPVSVLGGGVTPADNQSQPFTLPNIGAAGMTFTEPPLVWMTIWQFHCERPTTPCDSMYGMCNSLTGQCNCFNQAFGLRCEAANEALKNAGVCAISNPCKHGVCYDNGVSAQCSCPDGFYGDHCEHRMVYAECTQEKMVVNVLPYGFSEMMWNYIPAPSTGNCSLERMSQFLAKASSYKNRGWSGFAREFRHKGDLCAGDAVLEHSNVPNTKVYSREVYVNYDAGRHFTDTKVKVTCEVTTTQAASGDSLSGLPPPRVNIQLLDSIQGRQLRGPVKVGSSLVVKFFVNPVNNANIDDLRVEMCTVSDGVSSQKIIVVDNGCVVPPVGKSIQAGGQLGTRYLTMAMYRFPLTPFLHFSCRVRLCDSVVHACSQARSCFGRRKRSTTGSDVSQNAHVMDMDFRLTH